MNEERMTMDREAKILDDAVAVFGADAQTDMMIEEMSELTKALLKMRRVRGHKENESVARMNVLEELADVGIMLSQMEMIYGDCTDWEIWKLERLEKRIEEARAE